MKKAKTNFIFLALILVSLPSLYFFFQEEFKPIKYGKDANKIRENVKIPFIDSDMKRVRNTSKTGGDRWENKAQKEGLIHLWKIVIPGESDYLLNEELDLYKKSEKDDKYWQLNLNSKIIGDSASIRKATLRFYNGHRFHEYVLDEKGIDSIFKKWELRYLVK